jgi:DNA-binding NarL/FixJ family response regulator
MATVDSVIRVLLVDDDPLVRSALRLMLGGQPDLDVIGEAPDGRAGVAVARAERPDVVLMDIRMPVLNGLEATRALHADPDPPRVIVLTTFDADEHVLGALAAGADGFVLKDTPPGEIVEAIRRVAAGDPMLSPSVTATLIRQVRDTGDDRSEEARRRLAVLTERETEVAVAVGRGLSNAEIAAELVVSETTVKTHVARMLMKLGLRDRVQAVVLAYEAGIAIPGRTA